MKSIQETKSERFVRVAENRVNRIAIELEALAKMPRHDYYECTPEQIASIFDFLRCKLDKTERAFIDWQNGVGRFSLSEESGDR